MANMSKTYFLPYMADYINIKFPELLEDTYISLNNEYKFCMLYTFKGKNEFLEYEKELKKHEYFTGMYDPNKRQVLYTFDIPEELFDTLDLFLSGKYSYLPQKDKIKLFLRTKYNVQASHKIFHILDRSDELRKMLGQELGLEIPEGIDLASPPNLDLENYTI